MKIITDSFANGDAEAFQSRLEEATRYVMNQEPGLPSCDFDDCVHAFIDIKFCIGSEDDDSYWAALVIGSCPEGNP